MKYINFSLFFILLIGSIIYFSQEIDVQGNDTSTWKTVFNPEKQIITPIEHNQDKVSEGFGFGIYQTYEPRVGMNLTQNLKENENFECYLDISNVMRKENNYLLFALLDYKQIPFYINGSKNETYLASLRPMEEKFYSFKIDKLSPGFHDLLIGVFLNPYEQSLNSSYRYDTDFSMMGSKRLNIIVENSSAVMPEFKNFKVYAEPEYPLEGLLVNKEPCSSKSWLVENVTENEILKYYINLGNNEKRNRTCAIVQFLDYKQIPIGYNSSEYVFFGYLDDGKKGSIPASLKVPDKVGVHELIVVWISDPYKNLEIAPERTNTKLENRVEPSIRIGLNTEGKKKY